MRWIFFSLLLVNLVVFAWGMVAVNAEPEAIAQSKKTADPFRRFPELVLLSERKTQGSGDDVVNEDSAPARQEAPQKTKEVAKAASVSLSSNVEASEPGKEFCELVGPFKSTQKASDFVERLRAIEVSSSVREIELPAGPGYWVYLKPQSSRRNALRLLSELQAKRIDSYVIPKGELENGISLGMFSKKASSDARITQMKGLGFEPEVEEVERTYRETWVMLFPGEGLKMSELSWKRAMEGINLLERRQNYCLGVASSENIH